MKGKKILAWLVVMISVSIISIGLSGCKFFQYDGHFFDKPHLKEHLIPDLPKSDAKVLDDYGQSITLEMTEEEFEQYAREIYEYMLSCNFEKLGTPGSIWPTSSNSGVHECSEFEDYKHYGAAEGHVSMYSCYLFAWSNERFDETRWTPHFLEIGYYSEGYIKLELCNHIAYSIYD